MNILKPITTLFSQKQAAPIVEARAATPMSSIIQPKAQDRLYELIEREQLPGDVRETLAGALTGDLQRQGLLFQAMIDTWPRLQKNLTEIARSVSSTPWEIQPYSEQGDEPTDSAIEKARMVQTAIEGMSPRPAWDELSERGLVKSLVRGYYQGHEVCEVFWDRKAGGTMPRAAKIVPPRFYDYPDTGDDRLMFSPDGGFYSNNFEDFPEHHFLVAVNRGHGAHPSIAAPLRALTGYWLAATFGLKWLLQFSQLYGMPFRWASYEDESVKSKVCNMLENIGSAGWGAFPKGTEIEFINAGQSADSLPQAMLLEMADTQCDTFILGQTLTTDVGNSGSRALGDVHQEIRAGVIQGVSDFVGDIFNHQLIPSIIKLNYGNDEELPTYKATVEAPKDEIGMAQRDQTLISMGMEVGKEWLYERHGVPMPEEGDDDIFQPSGGNGGGGDPRTGSNRVLSPNETDPAEADPDQEVEAAYNPSQKRAEKGSDNGGQWVSEDGSNSKGDKPKKSRGLSDEELARHAELEAKHGAGTLTDEERDEAQELVDKAARLAGYDVDNPMYHGTTHNFETFDPSIGSPEGDFGRGNYLTSSLEDAEANYAGGGPDLAAKIELEEERLGYAFDEAETPEEVEAVAERLAEELDLDSASFPRIGADENLDDWKVELTRHIANRHSGGDDRLITAYVKLDNPAIIGANADGRQMYVDEVSMYDEEAMAEYKPEAEDIVRESQGLGPSDDVDRWDVREVQVEWADNNGYYNEELHPLQEAVRKVAPRFDDTQVQHIPSIDNIAQEGGSYGDIATTLRERVFPYASNDKGQLVVGEAVRQVFEEMGHDAIIDYRVDDKFGFGQGSNRLNKMQGLNEGDYHIISFKSSQIKSADIFTGTPLAERFDDKDDRITFSHAVQAYDPNQKRADKGADNGGQWVKDGGDAKDKMPTSAAEMGLMAREAADYWDEERGFYDVGFPITPEEYQKNFGEAVENKGIISDINDPFRKQVNRELAVQMNNEEFNKFLDAGPKFVVVPYKGEGLSPGDFGRNSMSLGNAAGMTVRLNKRAERMGYGIWGDEVDPGSGNIGVDVGSVIRHEYGHIFWQNAMSKDQRTGFFDKVKDASIISSYAESSNDEVFPEALALVTHPKFDKNKYPDWVGEMSDWMKKELTK